MQRFLHRLLNARWKTARVAHHATLPPREAEFGTLEQALPETLWRALRRQGVRQLYRHQVEALEKIRNGRHVVVATPTASGKSLIYNLAVAESLLRAPQGHALYLFPIKALGRDQLEALDAFLSAVESVEPIRAAVYDGDTTAYQRAKIRQAPPQILLSNPDMLHYALLAYHGKWEAFWRALRFVIVDEMHTYRGVFGSHVAQVFRRLRRVCNHYGSHPRFIQLSATIANPEDLARQLTGEPADVVRSDSAPQATRHFVFMETEESLSGLAARLVVLAARENLRTIVFTQSRRLTELVHMSVTRMAPQLARRVSSYRAGFLPSERRTIEQKLAGGQLAAVISTSALEMGIDIGGLDVCILVGYPGTVMTTWQRGWRVGRTGRECAIVLLPQPDALDQYIVHHPETLLDGKWEVAVADPMNAEILKAHLPCAAAELPLTRQELGEADSPVRRAVEQLVQEGTLLQSADGERWFSLHQRPHRAVDIRSVGPSYAILTPCEDGKWIPLGKSEGIRALKECHPGAVYLHRGRTYRIERLDLENRVIHAVARNDEYFTRIKNEKETEILETLASKPEGNFMVRLGRLRVTEQILGYEKLRLFTQERLDFSPLELPPHTFETVGFWIEIEDAVARKIREAGLHFMGGIHAVEHAAIAMFPLFALCDRNDIGGIAIPLHPQIQKSAVFIYDGTPGGIGLAARGYEIVRTLLEKTRNLLEECPCEEGCPACIHSPKCGSGNKPLDKRAALDILRYLLGDQPLFDAQAPGSQEPPDTGTTPVEPSPEPPPRLGFLDIETQRLAQEVGGWNNKHLMRVSVAVLHDSADGRFHAFREADIHQLVDRLHQFDLIVGFNIKSFDYAVLQAYTPRDLQGLATFDILEAVRRQLGFRLSLDHLAEKTLGRRKTADGLQAVRWFREGRWDLLTRYCEEDVALTRDIFFHGVQKGYLIYENRDGHKLRIPTPWDLKTLVRNSRPATAT